MLNDQIFRFSPRTSWRSQTFHIKDGPDENYNLYGKIAHSIHSSRGRCETTLTPCGGWRAERRGARVQGTLQYTLSNLKYEILLNI